MACAVRRDDCDWWVVSHGQVSVMLALGHRLAPAPSTDQLQTVEAVCSCRVTGQPRVPAAALAAGKGGRDVRLGKFEVQSGRREKTPITASPRSAPEVSELPCL